MLSVLHACELIIARALEGVQYGMQDDVNHVITYKYCIDSNQGGVHADELIFEEFARLRLKGLENDDTEA